MDHHILMAIQTAEAQRYVIGVTSLEKEDSKKAYIYYFLHHCNFQV